MKTDLYILAATCAVAIAFPRLGVALDADNGGSELVRETALEVESDVQPPLRSGTLEPAHWRVLQVPPTDGPLKRSQVATNRPVVQQEALAVPLSVVSPVLLGNADASLEASMRRYRQERMMKSLVWILPIGFLGFIWYLVRRLRKPDW